MKLTLLAIAAALTASCSPRVYDPPSPLPTPPRAREVQSASLTSNIENVKAKGQAAKIQSAKFFDLLQQAETELSKAREIAKSTLEEHPDSKRVKELSEALKALGGSLRAAQKESVLLQLSLDVVVIEAESARKSLHEMELDIAGVKAELNNYRSMHESANEKLSYSSKAITQMNAEVVKSEERLNQSRAWTIRWASATVVLVLLNAARIYLTRKLL